MCRREGISTGWRRVQRLAVLWGLSLFAAGDQRLAEAQSGEATLWLQPACTAWFAEADWQTPASQAIAEADCGDPAEARAGGSLPEPVGNDYVPARSTSTRPETEPPRYVRTASDTGWCIFEHADWLDIGLDYRLRYEYRDKDLRRPEAVLDLPFLLRARGYLGIRELADPLRGYIEFEDARRYNSEFPADTRDFNEHEIIQAVAELYFQEALGPDRPFRFQAGRMAFEYVDRRLIARNEWRNTTNNFEGFRAILGQETNDWQIDLLGLQPVDRRIRSPDVADRHRWFYGAVVNWRRWSDVITLQPYYLVLDQRGGEGREDREIHTAALRGYGVVGQTGWDYDGSVVFQYGHHGERRQSALGYTSELGYTWSDHEWKPRLGVFCGYGSGDRDPNDGVNQRFDRLFGFARPWSANDYFLWENLLAPKTRLEFQPHENLRVDMGYGVFWLASATDLWANADLHDPTGQSGDFVGHEIDVRARWQLTPRVDVTLGYAYFLPGEFVRNQGRPEATNFFYIETLTNAFK